MIDLHAHLLPGLDDGPATLEESVELARGLAAAGVHTVSATPHVRGDYPTEPDEIQQGVREVRAALDEAGIALRVLAGAELSFEELGRPPEELRRFGLAGNPSLLLVETPYTGWPLAFESTLFGLRLAGFTIVLGHPERNPDVQADPGRVERLVGSGALVQVTTSSLTGAFGRRPRAIGLELIERGLAHVVASDTHGPDGRSLGAAPVERAVGDAVLARWLTEDAPAALVAGEPLPPRPPAVPRGRLGGLRRRGRR